MIPREVKVDDEIFRRRERKLCKLTAIPKWIETCPETPESIKKTIASTLSNQLEKAREIQSIKWDQTTFIIGETSYTRLAVPTNPDCVEIPKELRKPALAEVLNLENYIEYEEVPDYYIEKVQEIIGPNAMDLSTIPTIVNYVQSQLDPKVRHLPIMPGMDPKEVHLLHAIVQPNYRIIGLGAFFTQKTSQNQILTELCMNILHHVSIIGLTSSKYGNILHHHTSTITLL
ncbi:unnamed protein product [Acanthoscelides obtectus]|uniref:Uncharacterized protein n=1 Tax=Acanthoscelides obtectus TaxID=200917 RepID=A0A9P0M4S1_ACAOB|nr:unnamed protein product [Acanthoscelides obtectus]CAK1623146.1 Polymerase basic protein 2 [Acanthoscelides obtectus]